MKKITAFGGLMALWVIGLVGVSTDTPVQAQDKKAGKVEIFSHFPGTRSDLAVKPGIVADAFIRLGHRVEYHTDKQGRPHFVILDLPEGVKTMAVFFNDCHVAGCEDTSLYADFGSIKEFGFAEANRWNHPNDRLRSKAFVSTLTEGNPVGISTSFSFMDESDADQIAWNVGMFIIETKIFVARHVAKK